MLLCTAYLKPTLLRTTRHVRAFVEVYNNIADLVLMTGFVVQGHILYYIQHKKDKHN